MPMVVAKAMDDNKNLVPLYVAVDGSGSKPANETVGLMLSDFEVIPTVTNSTTPQGYVKVGSVLVPYSGGLESLEWIALFQLFLYLLHPFLHPLELGHGDRHLLLHEVAACVLGRNGKGHAVAADFRAGQGFLRLGVEVGQDFVAFFRNVAEQLAVKVGGAQDVAFQGGNLFLVLFRPGRDGGFHFGRVASGIGQAAPFGFIHGHVLTVFFIYVAPTLVKCTVLFQKGFIPFYLTYIVVTLFIILIPQISTALPIALGYIK